MSSNPRQRITAEQRAWLKAGKADIVFTGFVSNEGTEQPISIVISELQDLEKSQNDPLKFTIQFNDGATEANRIDFEYKSKGEWTEMEGQELETGIKRGADCSIVLHVKPNTYQAEFNSDAMSKPVARAMGLSNANFIAVTGQGVAKGNIDIKKSD